MGMKEVLGDKVEKVMVQRQNRRFTLRSDYVGVRLVCQYGAYHESASSSRQFHDFLHGFKEDHGGEPNPLHHDGVEEEGFSRQIRQDSEGFDLASLRHVSADLRLQSG